MNLQTLRDPRLLAVIGAVILLLGWLLIVRPMEVRFRERLTKLDPAAVERITLETEQLVGTQVHEIRVQLPEVERREFLQIVAAARAIHPNHPRGGWTCFARITTKAGEFYFPIYDTSNNGTYLALYSNGTQGWNMGTLRNDALKPFVERVLFSKMASEAASNGGPSAPRN